MSEMYQRKILQGDLSPHVASPQVWNNSRSLRFMIRNLMYIGGRKPSMAWSKTPRRSMRGLITVRWSWDSLGVKSIQTITWRLWMMNLSYRHLCLTGADPLIYRRQRELDSECGKIRCKLVIATRILTFRSYMVMMSDQICEMPLSFINSFALMFLENLCLDICVAVSMVSSYLVEPH